MEIFSYQNGRDYAYILNSLINEKYSVHYHDRVDDYKWALETSYTYVAYIDEQYAGYIRAISDGAFSVMICELIVEPRYRQKGVARELIREIRNRFKGAEVIISCKDTQEEIFEKLSFKKIGSSMSR